MKKLFFNGDIVTVNENQMTAEAVYVENGKIVDIGSDDALLKYKVDGVELIDLDGKTMMPGFIDAHSHFGMALQISGLTSLASAPNGNIECIDDIVNALIKSKDNFEPNEPIYGFGFDAGSLKENRPPNKFDLDKVATDRTVIAIHASGHTAATNSYGLKHYFNYDETTKDPKGGRIERIDGTNEPTGYLEELAFTPVFFDHAKSPSKEKLKDLIVKGQDVYIKTGITTVQEGKTNEGLLNIVLFAQNENLLKVDVRSYPFVECDIDSWNSIKMKESIGHVKICGRKIILDGSLQARTGWLLEPYEVVDEDDDKNYCGYSTRSDEYLLNSMETCAKENSQILVHCNGDAAAEQMIRCWKKILEKYPNAKNTRPVMVHAQTTTPKQLEEMKKIGIMPTFFASHPFYWGDTHLKNLGVERATRTSNVKKAIELGMNYTSHEDYPVVPSNPLFTVWVMTNRLTKKGIVLGEDYKISVLDALKAITINGAYQYFEEDIKGSIEIGKLADFVITDKNILKIDTMDIKDVKVLETIKEGETIYKA